MLISRQLRIALLISFLWHFFWMCAVNIVFLPRGGQLRQYSSIAFLGSILRNSFAGEETLPAKKPDFAELPAGLTARNFSIFEQTPPVSLALEKISLNPDNFVELDSAKEVGLSTEEFVSTKSTLKEREVIFRPATPEYPEWTQQGFISSSVIFHVYISADGLVEETTNIQGSGNPQIDAALARYIRKWRFAPRLDKQGTWQMVKISLDL